MQLKMCTWLSSFLPLLSAVVSLAYFPMASKEEPLGFVGEGFFYCMMLYIADQIDFSPEMSMITRSILKK